MASLLLWLSWSDPIDEVLWQRLAARAAARCSHAIVERSGPGWRLLARVAQPDAPTPLLALPCPDGGSDLLLLDRAEGADDRMPRTADDDWSDARLFDGTPSASIRLEPGAPAATLCRDLLGQRSLVYAAIPGGFLAASGEDVLLAHPAVSDARDPDFLAALLASVAPAQDATAFRAIRRLQPGETLRVDASSCRRRRLSLAPDASWRGRSDAELATRYAELLAAATANALRGAHRIGLSQSAGLDSSVLAVLAAPHALSLGAPLLCVTQGLAGDPAVDERAAAAELARSLGAEAIGLVVDELVPFGTEPPRPICPDTPWQSPFREWKEASYVAFKARGVDRVLGGNFGDHLFAGAIDAGWDALRLGRWPALRGLLGAARADVGIAGLRRRPELRRIGSRLLGRDRRPPTRLALLAAPWRSAAEDRWRAELDVYAAFPRPQQAALLLDAWAAFDSSGEDWYAQRHGIDARSPYRDLALTRFCLSIPADLSQRDGQSKWLARAAFADRLPDGLRLRPKGSDLTGFQERAMARQRDRLADDRRRAQEETAGLLDPVAVAGLDADAAALLEWQEVALGRWLRQR